MKFTRYIDSNHVFTTAQLMASMDSPASAEEQLRLAIRKSAVERARRGLLVSNHGRFQDAPLDPAELVSALDPDAVLSYHSALEAWGVAHNVGFSCQFRSSVVKNGFTFRGVSYEPFRSAAPVPVAALRTPWGRKRVTSREQTVLDCLNRPGLAGGVEEAVRGVTAFTWIDVDALARMSTEAGPSAMARAGWLLAQKKDDWHVDDGTLARMEASLGQGPYRLGHASAESGWSSPWKLILPEPNQEIASWITRT